MNTTITALLAAADEPRDIGKTTGIDMSEGWGMVIAAVFTGLFVFAAGLIAYRAGRRQVADQAAAEHRAWRRQNRLEAYQRFITVIEEAHQALEKRLSDPESGNEEVLRALERMLSAETAIRLAGPAAMAGQARDVTKAVHEARGYVFRPRSAWTPAVGLEWTAWVGKIVAAEERFVEAAAKVLDDPGQ